MSNKKFFNRLSYIIVLVIIGLSSIFQYIFQLNALANLLKLNEIMLSSVLIFVSIFASIYFVFLQIYKDRFTFFIVKETFMPYIRHNMILILSVIIWGSIIIGFELGAICQISFIASCFMAIFFLLYSTYTSHKSLMLTTYVRKITQNLIKAIEENTWDIKNTQKTIDRLRTIYNECLTKCEYNICVEINRQMSEIFKKMLAESNRMCIEDGIDKTKINDFYSALIIKTLSQFVDSRDFDNNFLVKSLISDHYNNINKCISVGNYDLFKKYIKELNSVIVRMQYDNSDEDFVSKAVSIYLEVVDYCNEKEKDKDEYIIYIIEEFFNVTMALNYIKKDSNLKHCASIVMHIMYLSIKNKNTELYSKCFSKFKEFTLVSADVKHSFDDILIYYTKYFSAIIKNKDNSKIEDYLNIVQDCYYYLIEDERWNAFVNYCFHSIEKEFPEIFTRKIHQINIDIIHEMISSEIDFSFSRIPNYEALVIKNKYDLDEIKKICTEIFSFINRAILANAPTVFYFFIKKISESIKALDKSNKDPQIELFKLYMNVLIRSSQIKNTQFLDICFSELEDCIRDIDKEQKVSGDLAQFILERFENTIRITDMNINNSFTVMLLDLLDDFMDTDNEILFIYKYLDKRKLYYQIFCHIGVDCIETAKETLLRKVSNYLGWLIKKNIDKSSHDDVKYLLEIACRLFDISQKMEVSKSTRVFMLTLFTTIGAYCFRDPLTYNYRDLIIDKIKDISIDEIKLAITIRDYEQWAKSFGCDMRDQSKKFLNECTARRKD